MKTFLLSFVLVTLAWATPRQAKAEPLTDGYRALSYALAHDDYAGTQRLAADLSDTIANWIAQSQNDPRLESVRTMELAVRAMAQTTAPKALRSSYKSLSGGALRFIAATPDLQASWQLWYCPMVKAYWAQPANEEIMNPYHGLEMIDCGVKKKWASLPF